MSVLGGASRQSLAEISSDFEKQISKLSADAALKLSNDLFVVLPTVNVPDPSTELILPNTPLLYTVRLFATRVAVF